MTELDLPPLLLGMPFLAMASPCCCAQQKHSLFAALDFALCMQIGNYLPHAGNRPANAKSGAKKTRGRSSSVIKGKINPN